MGGHARVENGLVLDMLPFDRMSLDERPRLLTVGAGARWSHVIPLLDKKGLAVAVMQSNNDFTVGGSISVNCHGWQNDSPPIASSRVLPHRYGGWQVRQCSRKENSEPFRWPCGEYGLFGIILDVKLRAGAERILPRGGLSGKSLITPVGYEALTEPAARMSALAYGRICGLRSAFLEAPHHLAAQAGKNR